MKTFDLKLYNDMPLSEGMKIAPMVVENRATSISMGMNPQNMKTYKSKVHGMMPYCVSFIEVSEEQYDDYMKKTYRDHINDYFDNFGEKSYKDKFSRCKLEDGLPCSAEKCCGSCKRRLYPDKPELSEDENPYLKDIREKNSFTSYEELVEAGYEGATVSGEAEVRLLYHELLESAGKVSPYYPSIIRFTIEGYSKKEIIQKLGFEDNSSSYRKVNKALQFAHDYLTD